MSKFKMPMPRDSWYVRWNYAQENIDEAEKQVLDETFEKLRETINQLLKIETMLHRKDIRSGPKEVIKMLDQVEQALDSNKYIMQCIVEMCEDPYQLAEKMRREQQKLQNGE